MVPGRDDAPDADLQRHVEDGEAELLEVQGQPLVALSLPIEGWLEARGGAIEGHKQVESRKVDSRKVDSRKLDSRKVDSRQADSRKEIVEK